MRLLIFIVFILFGKLAMALTLTSSAFQNNQMIPEIYTCKGKDISPPLSWSGAPATTKSYALIMNDPDALGGTWDHWILFNIPSSTTELAEAVTILPEGTMVLKNSWEKAEYGGPCPPSGTHRYQFQLYALNAVLDPQYTNNKLMLLQAVNKHQVAHSNLVGHVHH
jgi:Raf kinase inhibitor-like YbhB/YbcL family protein